MSLLHSAVDLNYKKKPKDVHPWAKIIKPSLSDKINRAHNSVNNPDVFKKKVSRGENIFHVIGDRFTEEYVYCVKMVKALHKYRRKIFDKPIIQGVTNVEWPKIMNEYRLKFGANTFCTEGRVLLVFNNRFLGGIKELKDFVTSKYVYYLFHDNKKAVVTEFANYVKEKRLFADIVPRTCENFIKRCSQKRGGYGGTPIHRIVKDSWIQCGGFNLKKWELACENFIVPPDKRGILGMANDGRDIDCSRQFFVLLQPQDWMRYHYVAFGELIDGDRTLKEIENSPTWNEAPTDEIMIYRAGLLNLDAHEIVINPHAGTYIQSHIENLIELGNYLIKELLDRAVKEIQFRDSIRVTLWKLLFAKIKSIEGEDSNDSTDSSHVEIREEHFAESKYLRTEDRSSLGSSSLKQPVKNYFIPLTDVPYPDEVDSAYDLKKFLRGDYCHESDIIDYDRKATEEQERKDSTTNKDEDDHDIPIEIDKTRRRTAFQTGDKLENVHITSRYLEELDSETDKKHVIISITTAENEAKNRMRRPTAFMKQGDEFTQLEQDDDNEVIDFLDTEHDTDGVQMSMTSEYKEGGPEGHHRTSELKPVELKKTESKVTISQTTIFNEDSKFRRRATTFARYTNLPFAVVQEQEEEEIETGNNNLGPGTLDGQQLYLDRNSSEMEITSTKSFGQTERSLKSLIQRSTDDVTSEPGDRDHSSNITLKAKSLSKTATFHSDDKLERIKFMSTQALNVCPSDVQLHVHMSPSTEDKESHLKRRPTAFAPFIYKADDESDEDDKHEEPEQNKNVHMSPSTEDKESHLKRHPTAFAPFIYKADDESDEDDKDEVAEQNKNVHMSPSTEDKESHLKRHPTAFAPFIYKADDESDEDDKDEVAEQNKNVHMSPSTEDKESHLKRHPTAFAPFIYKADDESDEDDKDEVAEQNKNVHMSPSTEDKESHLKRHPTAFAPFIYKADDESDEDDKDEVAEQNKNVHMSPSTEDKESHLKRHPTAFAPFIYKADDESDEDDKDEVAEQNKNVHMSPSTEDKESHLKRHPTACSPFIYKADDENDEDVKEEVAEQNKNLDRNAETQISSTTSFGLIDRSVLKKSTDDLTSEPGDNSSNITLKAKSLSKTATFHSDDKLERIKFMSTQALNVCPSHEQLHVHMSPSTEDKESHLKRRPTAFAPFIYKSDDESDEDDKAEEAVQDEKENMSFKASLRYSNRRISVFERPSSGIASKYEDDEPSVIPRREQSSSKTEAFQSDDKLERIKIGSPNATNESSTDTRVHVKKPRLRRRRPAGFVPHKYVNDDDRDQEEHLEEENVVENLQVTLPPIENTNKTGETVVTSPFPKTTKLPRIDKKKQRSELAAIFDHIKENIDYSTRQTSATTYLGRKKSGYKREPSLLSKDLDEDTKQRMVFGRLVENVRLNSEIQAPTLKDLHLATTHEPKMMLTVSRQLQCLSNFKESPEDSRSKKLHRNISYRLSDKLDDNEMVRSSNIGRAFTEDFAQELTGPEKFLTDRSVLTNKYTKHRSRPMLTVEQYREKNKKFSKGFLGHKHDDK